jgi:hypothetical protein
MSANDVKLRRSSSFFSHASTSAAAASTPCFAFATSATAGISSATKSPGESCRATRVVDVNVNVGPSAFLVFGQLL